MQFSFTCVCRYSTLLSASCPTIDLLAAEDRQVLEISSLFSTESGLKVEVYFDRGTEVLVSGRASTAHMGCTFFDVRLHRGGVLPAADFVPRFTKLRRLRCLSDPILYMAFVRFSVDVCSTGSRFLYAPLAPRARNSVGCSRYTTERHTTLNMESFHQGIIPTGAGINPLPGGMQGLNAGPRPPRVDTDTRASHI